MFAITHRISVLQSVDRWLSTLLSAEQPMVNVLKHPGTFFWAQQYYFGLLAWCLHFGFEGTLTHY